jgi:hypothetical protein
MSWDEINKAGVVSDEIKGQSKAKLAYEVEIAKKYARIFESEDGKVVFEHLFKRFVMDNDTPLNSQNVTYEAGYHAGEAGLIKFITYQMTKAKVR